MPPADMIYGRRIGLIITRLLEESRKLNNDPEQAPAIQCHLLLRGQIQPMTGALARTPEGAFKFMTPATIDGRQCLMESFFDLEDIQAIMVERPIEPVRNSIIQSS